MPIKQLYLKTHKLYEIEIKGLFLRWGNHTSQSSEALRNGRANYLIFEELIREITGLQKTTVFDHESKNGNIYEQKSFLDANAFPKKGKLLQVSRSKTFGANNEGKMYKSLLAANKYTEAKSKLMKDYKKIDFFIFTNTGEYNPSSLFQYLILPRKDVIKLLDLDDPRKISRSAMLELATGKIIRIR